MRIRGIAASIPSRCVNNEEVLERVRQASTPSLSAEQMEEVLRRLRLLMRLSGCKCRRYLSEGEHARDHALRAANEALEKAQCLPRDIDLLIYVGVGRGWLEPGMSNFFTDALELRNATCFDLLDACLSWQRALHVAYHFLKNGVYRNILVLNAEFNIGAFGDWMIQHPDQLAYRFARFTVGEAATATVLTWEEGEEPYFEFKTDARLHTLCKIPLPHIAQYSESEVCPVLDPLMFFAYSAEMFQVGQQMVAHGLRNSSELKRRSFDIVFAHSASKTTIDRLDAFLGGNGRTINLFEEFGNTVSASIPLAMSWAIDQGRLQRGMRMLQVAASAGLSIGFTHLVY
jgi:3-oxoacyl-[acyl-carrier-protein] synthase III